MEKFQLVLVPSPGMGHLVSIVEFAKLLINHDHRVSVVVLIIRAPFDPIVDGFVQSLSSSPSISKRLKLILLPPYYPTTSNFHTHLSSFLNALVENQKPHVRQAVSHLNSLPDSPPLAAFVVDMFCTPMIDVANEFGLPAFVFFPSGVASLGFALHLHTLCENDNVVTASSDFQESGVELVIPSFASPVPAKVFPDMVLRPEWESFFMDVFGKGLKKAKGFIVNSFEELESHAVHSFDNTDYAVYPVGPILNLKGHCNPVQQGSDVVIEWLDHQPPSSVIFICFGSMGFFEQDHQVKEIARALENSGVHFLWSLRKPPPKGSIQPPCEYSICDLDKVLPEGFLKRTAGIGRIIGWAPQVKVLAHQAIGGFLSHCGWNSILESVHFGVPVATWPLIAEQQLNAFQLVHELKLGVEISLDYRMDLKEGDEADHIISAERIEKGIKQVMAKENKIRTKVKQLSEKSRKACARGGSSYSHLDRLMDDLIKLISTCEGAIVTLN